MSENEDTKAGKCWTDRQRLAYLFSLIEFSNVKLDFINAPRPDGRSVHACRFMVVRLKNMLKTEIAALQGDGSNGGEANATPKKAATMPRKRKAVTKDVDSMPSKKVRKKKEADDESSQDGGEDEIFGKAEVKEEEFKGV
ncbi:hypothetical protein yc1106_02440 [Curvularia clavata]|uniref:Uncharacterized protein n=1 Tax=Curvularia clavata TaxID=95742 RepID=A0A9Q8Z3C7_CURCL|nr:hypothetical protein yc1106_02440 [Curvularia clavata]